MVKIKMECWWTNCESLKNRFLKQFVSDDKFEFVIENPDYTIVFGRTNWESIETPKDRTFYFSQEPLWSPNEPKENIHEYCSKIFVADKRCYPDRDEYIETLLPMFYGGSGDIDSREEWDWSSKIKDKNYIKDKTISMVVRKDGSEHYGHLIKGNTSEINYNRRTKLAIKLSENEKVDIFGIHWENNGKNIKGSPWNKHIALDEYKFSIACENSIQKNYISEKFWDLILTDTIPIYLGCNNIYNHVDPNYFISLNGLSENEIINKIQNIIDNESDFYKKYIGNVRKLKQDFFKNPVYNLWERIKKEIT